MPNISGPLPDRFVKLIGPILIQNEMIRYSFRESFKWETVFRRWLVLTNFRLLVCSRTLFGVDSSEFHLREMDVERVRDNIGLYDSIVFKSRDKVLVQVAVFRTRRKEAEEFLREVTRHIAERDLYISFPNNGQGSSQPQFIASKPKKPVSTRAPRKIKTTPEERKQCEMDREHARDLNNMGAITDAELKEEEAKPCKK